MAHPSLEISILRMKECLFQSEEYSPRTWKYYIVLSGWLCKGEGIMNRYYWFCLKWYSYLLVCAPQIYFWCTPTKVSSLCRFANSFLYWLDVTKTIYQLPNETISQDRMNLNFKMMIFDNENCAASQKYRHKKQHEIENLNAVNQCPNTVSKVFEVCGWWCERFVFSISLTSPATLLAARMDANETAVSQEDWSMCFSQSCRAIFWNPDIFQFLYFIYVFQTGLMLQYVLNFCCYYLHGSIFNYRS